MICLIVGHKFASPGARNVRSKLTEYDFNNQLAADIAHKSDSEIEIVYRKSYSTLPSEINEIGPEYSISLHCNAFNRKANGCEVLYYHSSKRSREIAAGLQKQFVLIGLRDRGIEPKHSEDRGGYLLRYTNDPCVIAEPFFIDNDDELQFIHDNYDKLVDAYIKSIDPS